MYKPTIYRIRNTTNDKFYVGSTVNTKTRFTTHRSRLRRGKHHSAYLQAAWNKHGEANFAFEVLEELEDAALLQDAEDRWLVEHVGKKHCYNTGTRSGAPWRGVPKEQHPSYGRKLTPAESAAISNSVRDLYLNPAYQPRKGRKHDAEARAKISTRVQEAVAAGRGGKFIPTTETRRLMSEALKGNQNAKGHVRTAEHRHKLSDANKGNTNFLGRKHTEEAKTKLRKRVLEEVSGLEFPSLTATLEYFGMTMPTLRRALVSGAAIGRGRYKGRVFRYVA